MIEPFSDVLGKADLVYNRDLNQNAVNQPLEVESKSVGDTGSLFLYYSSNGPSDADIDIGAFVDIATSQPGVIRFTHAETFNFPIAGVLSRWEVPDVPPECSDSFGQTATVSDDFINELGAFGIAIPGMSDGLAELDLGYDPIADAFLFARVDYEVIGEGCVRIHVGPGQLGIVNTENAPLLIGVDDSFLDASFGSAIIPALGSDMILGDANCDGFIDLMDINCFENIGSDCGFGIPTADVNQDGYLDFRDFCPLVDIMLDQN